VDQAQLAQFSFYFTGGENVAQCAARFSVDGFRNAVEGRAGEDWNDERSGMHGAGRIGDDTNLHGQPFKRVKDYGRNGD
jgi:hypothetical protein